MSLSLTVPLPPNIANGRQHWRAKLKAKRAYCYSLDIGRMAGLIPHPPPEPPQLARIEVAMYLHQLMDDGNAMNRLKWIEDWLVGNGYLVDDSRKHLQYAGIPAQSIDRKNPRVELTITPLEAAA